MLGKIEGSRRRGQMRMRLLDGIIDSMNMSLSKLEEIGKDRKAWHAVVFGVIRSWTVLTKYTTKTCNMSRVRNRGWQQYLAPKIGQ